MRPTKRKEKRTRERSEDLLAAILRSIDLLVRLTANAAQGDRKAADFIVHLHSMGFRPFEIAAALGKTPNDVNPVLSRARKVANKTRKSATSRPVGR